MTNRVRATYCVPLIAAGLLVVSLLLLGCANDSPADRPSAPVPAATAALTQAGPTASPASKTDAPPVQRTLAVTTGIDWPTYHLNSTRTGYIPNMKDPQQLSVAWDTQLDGAVYAQPLLVNGHVIVATEGDTVYSINPATGQVKWKTHVGEPVRRAALPCGNIDPLGITGTPVYDPATGLVFAVAEINPPQHLLVGLDINTGSVRVQRTVDTEDMNPAAHQQRAALVLSNGYVYIAFGGLFGDCGDYKGRVVASKTDGTGALFSYVVPTSRQAGIWAAAGPSVDSAGRLFVSVGNGAEVMGDWDHSDSVLRLSPMLQLEDGFAPDQWRQDNLTDADLGSLAPVLLPGNLVFIAGKAGIAYLLHADKLGGVGGQIQTLPLCHAYGGAAVVGSTLFVPCNEGVQQVQVANDQMAAGWRAAGVPGSPIVGGRTVYALDRSGTLHALDIATGQDRATVPVGSTTRFATPALDGDLIFVGTMEGLVAVTIGQ